MTILKRLREFLAPLPEFNDRWRCTFCKTEGQYVTIDGQTYFDFVCPEQRKVTLPSGREAIAPCPLVPIDVNGDEMSFEVWAAHQRS